MLEHHADMLALLAQGLAGKGLARIVADILPADQFAFQMHLATIIFVQGN